MFVRARHIIGQPAGIHCRGVEGSMVPGLLPWDTLKCGKPNTKHNAKRPWLTR